MDDRDDQGADEPDQHLDHHAVEGVPNGPSPVLTGDITFVDAPGGFEIFYSRRLANDHEDLVDQSADWLENELGAVNLGQIDHEILLADGVLTDEIRNGLVAWWMERVEDLDT